MLRRGGWTRAAFTFVCVGGGLATVFGTAGEAPAALVRVPGQVTLNTTAALTGLLVAYLALGRFRQHRLARDLALCQGLLLLGLGNLVFSVMPAVLNRHGGASEEAAVVIGLIGPAVLAVAAMLGVRRLTGTTEVHAVLLLLASSLSLLGTSYVVGVTLRAAQAGGDLGSADTFGTTSEAALTFLQIGAAVFLAIASVGWLRLAERSRDRLAGTLAVGTALTAFSRLNFALSTSPLSERVVAATVLRFGGYLVLLVGCAYEMRGYWSERAARAVLEERRRIARNLHDGLAQELAFAVRHSRRIDTAEGRAVAAATERALDESRRAIAVLTQPLDEPLAVAVAQTAEEVAGREGTHVRLQLDDSADVAPHVRETLVRIAREAITNATRHASASLITVALSNHTGITLSVHDDGCGFETPDWPSRTGRFGLANMRERAEAIGGELVIDSRPGTGTTVTVRLP